MMNIEERLAELRNKPERDPFDLITHLIKIINTKISVGEILPNRDVFTMMARVHRIKRTPEAYQMINDAISGKMASVGKYTIKKVQSLSVGQAEGLLPPEKSAIISIDDAFLRGEWEYRLETYFPDDSWTFNEFHARQILKWLQYVDEKVENIYVHCIQGISRAPAVARFISERYWAELSHRNYSYNPHIYKTLNKVEWE